MCVGGGGACCVCGGVRGGHAAGWSDALGPARGAPATWVMQRGVHAGLHNAQQQPPPSSVNLPP